jgi:hypothetical protein
MIILGNNNTKFMQMLFYIFLHFFTCVILSASFVALERFKFRISHS